MTNTLMIPQTGETLLLEERSDGNYNIHNEDTDATTWGVPKETIEEMKSSAARWEEAQRFRQAEEERIHLEREENIRQRKLALKKAFSNPEQSPTFRLALISNDDMLDDEILWYNTLSCMKDSDYISRATPGVYGYPATSKGGVQWQGHCSSEVASLFLEQQGFDIIPRTAGEYEVNGSALWRELIEYGLARVGENGAE